jgi:hypothetical protein
MTAKLHAIQSGPKKADPTDLLKTLDDLKAQIEAGEVTGIMWFELYKGNVFPGTLNCYALYPMSDLEYDGMMMRIRAAASEWATGFEDDE